jgi:hypothetical protein
MTDSSQDFDSLQERNQQVLNNITQLQIQEQDLHRILDDVRLTTEQKKIIINRINEISQMRMNLYAGLKDMTSFYKENVATSRNTLEQSITAIDILENELNESKIKLNIIEEQKSNKQRLVEINTYFGKRYNAHSNLMKIIVFICIPVIILTVLANKGILPLNIYRLLSVIILVIGLILIGLQLIDISNRDDMNWDEYDWYFDKTNAPVSNTYDDSYSDKNPWTLPSITCIGSDCCYDGSIYDSEKNICVPDDKICNKKTETFQGLGLEKYGCAQLKPTPLNNNVFPVYASLSNF